MPDDGLVGRFLLWIQYADYSSVLTRGLIWALVCAVFWAATCALIWGLTRYSRHAPRKLPYILVSIFWFCGPAITVIAGASIRAVNWTTAHAWLPPVAAAVVVGGVVAFIALRRWVRDRPHTVEPVQIAPPVQQPYSQPYGQWSRDEQVIQ